MWENVADSSFEEWSAPGSERHSAVTPAQCVSEAAGGYVINGSGIVDFEPYYDAAKTASSADSAHDFLHVERVLRNALVVLEHEGGRADIVIPAVLLHELFNYPKGHPLSHLSGDVCAERAETVLRANGYPEGDIPRVLTCIREHPFSKAVTPQTIEGRIVQDADRLDAIGAVGVARCFATCADMKRPFYNPDDLFCDNRVPDDKQWGIDHFFTKLLKLGDGMHTETAKRMAEERTVFMREFLRQFGAEAGVGMGSMTGTGRALDRHLRAYP